MFRLLAGGAGAASAKAKNQFGILTAFFFQTPLTKRPTKQMLRQTQSMTMAHQTPTAPQPMLTHKIQLNAKRQTSIETTDATIVNFTSLAARRALGRQAAGLRR